MEHQHHQLSHLNHHPLATYEPSSITSPQPSRIPSQLTTSSSLNSTTNNNSPKQILPRHYHTLMSGDLDGFRTYLEDDSQRICYLNNNTILHLAAITKCDDTIISTIIPDHLDLLYIPNGEGDLPIHLAARSGHLSVVKKLVECARFVQNDGVSRMLEATNREKNSALHVALENQQLKMAKLLFDSCPNTFYKSNNQQISPLYLAVKAGWEDLVNDMLRSQSTDAAENELRSSRKSVVHAIIMAAKPKQSADIFAKIMRQWPDLILLSLDEKGRRPLSYAAYTGYEQGVNQIMNDKKLSNSAYKSDEDGSFPIHRACMGGHLAVVKKLLSHSPGMKWLLNRQGQNILHVAARYGKVQVVEYILKQRDLYGVVNMMDKIGHTPLHLATMYNQPKVVYTLTWNPMVNLHLQDKNGLTALDLTDDYGDFPSFQERLTWLALIHAGAQKAPQDIICVQTINFPDVLNTNHSDQAILDNHENRNMSSTLQLGGTISLKHPPNLKKNKYKERLNMLLVVSTLVTTVTYASGFTVPGGNNQDGDMKGLAILTAKCAFQIFVITNTIAMYSSTLAVVSLIWAQLDDLRLTFISLKIALPLIGTALTMMLISFMSGLSVVLHSRPWLGWLVLVMGVTFLFVLLVFFIPLYSPTTCIKYKFLRWVVGVFFKLMLLACDQNDNSE